ncbi:E3 ubiquitin-protein ligase TRIM56 [Platysternon megacephalum]|uniref:E3 ubiquitin-protein ligase TRIM56 n=1 Tax=Platysternon megacephalum TaxID=55544 RepID=A0A4D9DN54_9SAUR|nr:E3 ubiquitin-protein ligase TRIM56 [Platysternon megacephalum]
MSRGAGQGPPWPRGGQCCGSLQRLPSGRAPGAKRPRCSQGLGGTESRTDPGGSAPILRLPPELLDHIVSFLPVRDAVALGQTCRYLRQTCDSEGVWRRLCRRLCPRLRQESTTGARPWKRAAILNYTKGLYFQTFGGRRRYLSKSVAPLLSHGYRKFLPTKEHVFVLDHGGTLFFLRNALVSSGPGHLQWKRACRCVVLCRSAKDFTTDPRSDAGYRKYVYVLAAREPAPGAGRACDCVEVYLQASGQRVFKMTFHAAMRFRQLVLVGQETERALLLLTEEGKIYSLLVNETQLDQPRSYTVQLALRKVSRCLPQLAVRAMASNQSSAAFLTGTAPYPAPPPAPYPAPQPPARPISRPPACPSSRPPAPRLPQLAVRAMASNQSSAAFLTAPRLPQLAGGPAYRELPPSRAPPPPESPGAQACEQYLSQLQGCPTLAGRLAKVREAVGALPLPPCQKDFLWEALELIRRSARPRSPPACS